MDDEPVNLEAIENLPLLDNISGDVRCCFLIKRGSHEDKPGVAWDGGVVGAGPRGIGGVVQAGVPAFEGCRQPVLAGGHVVRARARREAR